MQTGRELFKKIIIDGEEVDIDAIDANNGVYGNIPLSKTKIKVLYVYNDNVTSIPAGVFSGISSLKKVRFPSNIVSIADDAFTGSGIDSDSISTIKAINTRSFRYPITLSVSLQSITVQENGSVSLPTVTASSNNNTVTGLTYTYLSSDTSKVTISNGVLNGVSSGTATITVTFAGNDNYSGATVQYLVTVSAAQKSQLPNLSVTLSGWKYGSTTNSPVVTGNLENGTVSYLYKTDSTSYSNFPPSTSLAPGDYTLKATVAETTTYALTEATTTFTVSKADGSITISGRSLSYTTSTQALIVVSNATGTPYFRVKKDGQWLTSWVSNTIPTASAPGSYIIYYYVTATDYYKAVANEFSPNSVSSSISSSSITYTAPTKNENLIYNGQNLKLVNAGSVSSTYGTMKYSTDGTNWSTSEPQRKDACSDITVYWKIEANTGYEGINSTSITGCGIAKVTPTVTAPEAVSDLEYDDSAKTLISKGSTNYGTLKYSTDGTNYSTSLPTASNAGTYTVYYRVDGDNNINNVTAQTISVTIAKAAPTITKYPAAASDLTYTGDALDLITLGESDDGSFLYKVDNGSWLTDESPTATEVGEYTVYWELVGDSNHTGIDDTEPITVKITSGEEEEPTVDVSATSEAITETSEGTDDTHVKFKFVNNTGDTITEYYIHVASDNEYGIETKLLTGLDWRNGSTNEITFDTKLTPYNSIDAWGADHGNISVFTGQHATEYSLYYGQTYELGLCYTITFKTAGYSSNNTVSSAANTGSVIPSTKKIGIKVKNNTDESITINKVEFKTNNNGTVTSSGLLSIYSSAVTISSNGTSSTYEIDISDNDCKGLEFASDTNNIILYDSNDNALISVEASGSLTVGTLYTITYGEALVDNVFDTLLLDFNKVLYGDDDNSYISNNSDTYNYLASMYLEGYNEWNIDATSEDSLFNPNLYPEVVEYRNVSDKSGNAKTYEAMLAWLMAMCLAELTVSSGTSTNNQTKLFAKAMKYGDTDLYKEGSVDNNDNIVTNSNYGYKQDAMIARFVAGAIYAKNHDDFIDDINAAREELDGILIDGNDYSSIGASKSTTNIKYMPELDLILPLTPGPYTSNSDYVYSDTSLRKKVPGQSSSIIYDDDVNDDDFKQKAYNYKMDIAINKYVKEHYNLWSTKNDTDYSINAFKNSEDPLLVFEAGVIGICSKPIFFGKKKFKYLESIDTDTFSNAWRHEFDLADNTSETCGENEYLYKGPFSDWYEELFTNRPALNAIHNSQNLNGDSTHELDYLLDMLDIFDERLFTYYKLYGRRRPLGGISSGPVFSSYNHHPANGLGIATAARYLADELSGEGWTYNTISNTWDDWPTDSPKSYPSGHSAQSWGIAMLLSQIKPSMLKTYMKNAWKFGCERSIGRAHWNSDILFGRLSALTVLPVINAMNGTSFMTYYNSLREKAGNDTISKTGNSPGDDDVSNPVININVNITNDTGSPVTIQGRLRFVLGNPNQDGSWFAGYSGGVYIRTDNILFSNDSVTFDAGETKSYSNLTWKDADSGCGLGGASPLSSDYLPIYASDGSLAYARNILIYDGEGRSDTILCDNLSANTVFENNGTYNIVIKLIQQQ